MATPTNSRLPVIGGLAEVWKVLKCYPGTWDEDPTFSYQWNRDGSPIAGATSSLYLLKLADQGTAITCDVTATSGADSATATTTAVTPTAVNFRAGYRAGYNAGIDGDLFVDDETGDDGNAGTSTGAALATIGAAVAAVPAGGTIRVRAGKYRELVDMSSKSGTATNPTRILGYGTEKPIITAADVITGWTQCDSGDEAAVGPNYANIYKKTIATSAIASGNPRAAFPFENGQRMQLATEWLPNPKYPQFAAVTDQWLTADEVILDESDKILGLKLPSVTDNYTQGQIENADVYFHGSPNAGYRTTVASFSTETDVITLTDQTRGYEDNASRDKFALLNLLPAMAEGGWGYIDHGDSTVTLYIWPTDTDNLAAGIEYSARGKCLTFGSANYITAGSLVCERAASAGTATDGLYAVTSPGVTKKTGIRLDNLLVQDTYRAGYSYSPIWLQNVDGHVVQNCTTYQSIGQYGFFLQGGSSGAGNLGMCVGGHVDSCLAHLCENTGFRMFTQELHITSFCVEIDAGLSAHANKSNYYSLSHNCMWYGNNFLGGSGYITWSASSAISIVGCAIPTNYSHGDNRAIVDQNRSTGETPAHILEVDGTGYVLNNIVLPYSGAAAASNSIALGETTRPEVTFVAYNNVINGADATEFSQVDDWDFNLMTNGSAVGDDDVETTIAAEFTDHAKGDFSLKAGAAIRSMVAKDVSTEIAILQARYPNFLCFGRDMNGNEIDWSDPPIGPVDDYDQDYDFDPIWIDYPQVLGLPVPGETLSLSSGFLAASPYPALTYQWQRSDDGIAWANITDETSATYDTVEGDGGKFIACQVTPGTGPTYRAAMESALIVGGYPISDPVLLETKALWESGGTAKQLETDAFTASGKPLIVVVSCKGQLTDATFDVTIGTESRSFGTGTDLTLIGQGNRSGNQHAVLWIADPGSGSVTVQVEPDQNTNGLRIDVIEIDGVESVGTPATVGATATSRVTSVTTTESNSIVLHVLTRSNGSDSDTIAVAGATQILEGNDGNTGTGNTRTNVAFETSPAAGSFDATFSWTGNASCTALSVELIPGAIVSATVTTADPTFVTANSATLGGEVTDDGGAPVLARGICYAIGSTPTIADTVINAGTGVGVFSVDASGFAGETTYQFAAFVTTTVGTSYGTQKNFTTLAADVTEPTANTLTIAANGTSVTAAFSEAVRAGEDGWGGIVIAGRTLTYVSGADTSTVVFSVSPAIAAGTVTASHTQPGDGIQDAAGNLLASFPSKAVINNSEQGRKVYTNPSIVKV